jgi:hypothetical protein
MQTSQAISLVNAQSRYPVFWRLSASPSKGVHVTNATSALGHGTAGHPAPHTVLSAVRAGTAQTLWYKYVRTTVLLMQPSRLKLIKIKPH